MIYVIEEGLNGRLKIGTSVNVNNRIKNHQGSNSRQLNIVMTFEGGHALESKIHKDLEAYRIPKTKEWYHRVDEVAISETLKTYNFAIPSLIRV